MYTCIKLSPISGALLKWIVRGTLRLEDAGFVFVTDNGDPLPHHMTINLGGFDKTLNDELVLGRIARLTVREIVADMELGVCAATVIQPEALIPTDMSHRPLPITSKNKVPHITLCLKPGSKPKWSNDLLEKPSPHIIRLTLDEPYVLGGTVEEVH
jgi:hypothetical protein